MPTVSSHKSKSQNVKVPVSNPRTMTCLDLKMPFEGDKAPESEFVFPDRNFEKTGCTNSCRGQLCAA